MCVCVCLLHSRRPTTHSTCMLAVTFWRASRSTPEQSKPYMVPHSTSLPPLSLCAHNATSLPPSLSPSLTVCSQCYLPPSLPPSLTVCSQCPGAATPLCTTCWKRLRRTEWRASFSAKPANTSTWYVRPENSDMRSCIFSSILAQYHSPHTLLNCDAIIIVPINRSILMQCSPMHAVV